MPDRPGDDGRERDRHGTLAQHGPPLGKRRTSPRTAIPQVLVIVFGMPADELGLLDPEELAMRPATNDDGIEVLWRLVSMFSGKGEMDRETFMKGLLAFGAAPLLPSLLTENTDVPARMAQQLNASGGLSSAVVDDFEAITLSQRHLYWSTAPLPLYTSVKAHVSLGQELLSAGGSQAETRRLATALSESAMLAGRIAFFDLKRVQPAESDLTLALQATEEAGDHALAAAVLAHVSFLAAHNGDASAARAALSAATAHSRHRTGPLTRAWLSCVEAEVMASVNDSDTSMRALNRAEGLLPDEATNPIGWTSSMRPGSQDSPATLTTSSETTSRPAPTSKRPWSSSIPTRRSRRP